MKEKKKRKTVIIIALILLGSASIYQINEIIEMESRPPVEACAVQYIRDMRYDDGSCGEYTLQLQAYDPPENKTESNPVLFYSYCQEGNMIIEVCNQKGECNKTIKKTPNPA